VRHWVISRSEKRGVACDDAAVDHGIDPGRRDIVLLVVDDHPAIGLAIEAAIGNETPVGTERRPIRAVGSVRRVSEALELLAHPAKRPDVVLCDIQLETGIDGLDVVEAAHRAGIKSIVLTSFDRSSLMRAAFERGASGFLHKTVDLSAILAAVRTVAGGGTAFSAANLDAARYAPRPPSRRELEVIRELQSGATSEEIGVRLGISGRTVESHLRRLFDRYGLVSRTELVVMAISEGWLAEARP
jgi:two-component system, NarL family, response regulator DevR